MRKIFGFYGFAKSDLYEMAFRGLNFLYSGAQKRGSQIFRLRRAFFVVEALKTAKNR